MRLKSKSNPMYGKEEKKLFIFLFTRIIRERHIIAKLFVPVKVSDVHAPSSPHYDHDIICFCVSKLLYLGCW